MWRAFVIAATTSFGAWGGATWFDRPVLGGVIGAVVGCVISWPHLLGEVADGIGDALD